MKNLLVSFVFAIVTTALPAGTAVFPSRNEIKFTYISLLEPYDSAQCSHAVSESSPYEWEVLCQLKRGGKIQEHKFQVHLAVNFYPKTVHGKSAYEILYWVTDFSDAWSPQSDSSTVWIHHKGEADRVGVIEFSQGIENDAAYLKMFLSF